MTLSGNSLLFARIDEVVPPTLRPTNQIADLFAKCANRLSSLLRYQSAGAWASNKYCGNTSSPAKTEFIGYFSRCGRARTLRRRDVQHKLDIDRAQPGSIYFTRSLKVTPHPPSGVCALILAEMKPKSACLACR